MRTASGKDSLKRLTALVEASQLLNSTLDLDKVLSILLEILPSLVPSQATFQAFFEVSKISGMIISSRLTPPC